MIFPEGSGADDMLMPWRVRSRPPWAARREPPDPRLLEEILDGLQALPDEPPDHAARTRIAGALGAESDRNPAWTHAVVFRVTPPCRPLRMPINSGWDYDLCAEEWQAWAALDQPPPPGVTSREVWERSPAGFWYPARPARRG